MIESFVNPSTSGDFWWCGYVMGTAITTVIGLVIDLYILNASYKKK